MKTDNPTLILRNHKAQAAGALTVIILCLVIGIILIAFGYKMVMASDAINEDEKCRLSIFTAASLGKIREASWGIADLQNALDCPRKKFYIERKHVMKSGRISDKLVKDTIGMEMAACWNKVGKGEMDPFKKKGGFWGGVDDKFCMVCAEVIFTDDFKKLALNEKPNPYEILGFHEYMATRRLPAQKVTLNEYLGGKGQIPTDAMAVLRQTSNDESTEINFNIPYVIVWRIAKYEASLIAKVGGFVAGAAVGAIGIILIPVTAGTSMIAAGAVVGAAVGSVGVTVFQGDQQITQQVFLVPESFLSDELVLDPAKPDDKSDFCTAMLN